MMEDDDFVCWVVLCCSSGDGGSTWRISSASFLFLRSATYRKRREAFNVKLALRHPSRASEVDPLGETTNFFIAGRFSRPVKEEALEELCCCCDVDGKSSIENFQPKTRILLGPIGISLLAAAAAAGVCLQIATNSCNESPNPKFWSNSSQNSSANKQIHHPLDSIKKFKTWCFFFFFFFFFFF
jgi:hypothetical protein